MQEEFVNIEYLRVLGMLSGDSNGQFRITLAARAAMEIGDIVRISPECLDGDKRRNQTRLVMGK
jgi:hypothetical protein